MRSIDRIKMKHTCTKLNVIIYVDMSPYPKLERDETKKPELTSSLTIIVLSILTSVLSHPIEYNCLV